MGQVNREQPMIGLNDSTNMNRRNAGLGASITGNKTNAIQRKLAGDMWANKARGVSM